jgi:hypothetical protein
MIIGAPAGKTSLAVLLVCGLLGEGIDREPVPVLLNVASWDPIQRKLQDWMAERITGLYRVLADEARFGPSVAAALLLHGRIVPVLDGLDELPEDLRVGAVQGINYYLDRNRPIVVTCRADQFEETIAASGTPLGHAAVVELQPVDGTTEAAKYLVEGQIDALRRWGAVSENLRSDNHGVLTSAFRSRMTSRGGCSSAYAVRAVQSSPEVQPPPASRPRPREPG